MSLKSWFGFPVTPENLTPTAALICIVITVVSVPVLLVVIVTFKCKQKKNRGSKNKNKTAERKSTESLSSGETENETKHSEVRKAQNQKDGEHKKEEVHKEVKEEVKTETLKAKEVEGNKTTPVSVTQSRDVKAEVRMVEDQNEGKENLQTPNKDLKTDNAELELSKSEDLKKINPDPEKQSVEISTPKEKLEKNEELTPDMLKENQKTSLKLVLAVTRRNKLEDTVDQFCRGKYQPMENELDNLKRALQAKEKELETLKWLRNYIIYEMPKSFSQLKFDLAISRVQKLEDKVEEPHGKDQRTNEKDLQILQWKLEAKEKQLKEKEAAALQLSDEPQTEEGEEKNLQTVENNSPDHVVSEEVDVAQQQLQGEEQSRGDDEVRMQTLKKRLQSINELLDKTAAMTPDMFKEKQETSSQLKLTLAVTRRSKFEDTVDKSGKNESMENELDNLKRTEEEKEVNEEVATAQQRLQREEQRRVERKNEFKDRVARFEQKLQGAQQQRREDAEEHLQDRKSSLSCDLDDLLKVIEKMDAELKMREYDVQMLKKELETNKKQLRQPSADHEDRSRIIDELKQTQNLLEDKNAEIRKMRKQFNTLNEEKQRNKEDLKSLKKELEAQTKKLEDKLGEVQQQLKDEQQSREEAEKDVRTLKEELENKNKELQESKCQFESLTEANQKSEKQLSELKERYKDEIKSKIQAEQQRREEVEEDVKTLKQELVNKMNQLQKEEPEEAVEECDISGERLVHLEQAKSLDNE